MPEIDYVWRGEPYLELVDEESEVIFSSHNIEHQPDLIRHLRQLGDIMGLGGQVYFAISDRRFCFDHYFQNTNFAGVFGACYDGRGKHTVANIRASHVDNPQ